MKRGERTLVLNASYEPMAVVSSRRALLLVLNEKASVLVESDRLVHTVDYTLVEPEVILLRQNDAASPTKPKRPDAQPAESGPPSTAATAPAAAASTPSAEASPGSDADTDVSVAQLLSSSANEDVRRRRR